MRRAVAAIALSLIAGWLANGLAYAADDGTPRRPRALLWLDETAGWRLGSAIRVDRSDPGNAEAAAAIRDPKYATAFLVASNGTWLTARKNVDQCRSIFIEAGAAGSAITRLMVIEVAVHETADVALLRTAGFRIDIAPMPMAPVGLESNEAFLIGFSNGAPAAVHAKLIGQMPPRRPGATSEEDVSIWGEFSRVPNDDQKAGVLAGGIVMNADKLGFGVVSTEQPRRGRFLASSNDAVRALLRREHVTAAPMQLDDAPELTDQTYPPVARRIIQERRVARLVCEPRQGSPAAPTHPRYFR